MISTYLFQVFLSNTNNLVWDSPGCSGKHAGLRHRSKSSSNSDYAVMFPFGLIPLRKAWNSFFIQIIGLIVLLLFFDKNGFDIKYTTKNDMLLDTGKNVMICSQFCGFKYSYLKQIICTQLYGFRFLNLIVIICMQLHDFKYFKQLYGFT